MCGGRDIRYRISAGNFIFVVFMNDAGDIEFRNLN